MKYIGLILTAFVMTGCCISFIDDTCVIKRDVPGPTRVVYKKCKLDELPSKPIADNNVTFKRISFDDKVYYGFEEYEASDYYINYLNRTEYCDKLEGILIKYKSQEGNSTDGERR